MLCCCLAVGDQCKEAYADDGCECGWGYLEQDGSGEDEQDDGCDGAEHLASLPLRHPIGCPLAYLLDF
jgi:hypothetical protein